MLGIKKIKENEKKNEKRPLGTKNNKRKMLGAKKKIKGKSLTTKRNIRNKKTTKGKHQK